MTFVLSQSNYGKSDIRLVKVVRDAGPPRAVRRHGRRHARRRLRAPPTTTATTARLLATDTMRNAVYVLARQARRRASSRRSGARSSSTSSSPGRRCTRAQVRLVAHPWARLGEHEHAFQRGGGGERDRHRQRRRDSAAASRPASRGSRCCARPARGGQGFLRDELTTLPETDDRILATAVSARWTYAEGGIDYGAAWQRRARRDPRGLRRPLQPLGAVHAAAHGPRRAQGRSTPIERVHLSLPNRHHLLYDLSRFGLENPNEVFHATTEPYGLIEGTVEREQ